MKKEHSIIIIFFLIISTTFVVLMIPSSLFIDKEILPQRYTFIFSSFLAGIVFLFTKQKLLLRVDYLTFGVWIFLLYLLIRQLQVLPAGCINIGLIISFLILYTLFKEKGEKHKQLIACLIVFGCFLQALYGLKPYLYIVSPSEIKGSFDNPAGFAACLVVAIPFCFYLYPLSRINKIIIGLIISILCVSIILSGSRAGMISGLAMLLFFLSYRYQSILQKKKKILLPVCFIAVTTFSIFIFLLKKDSATGRLLIWGNSVRMITKHPVIGMGSHSFQAHYMDYQGDYFMSTPESKYASLADNVLRPFNEYLMLTVEYGLIALFLLITLLFIICKYNRRYSPYLAVIIGIMIFSCFSYPLRYPIVLLVIAYCLAILAKQTPILTYKKTSHTYKIYVPVLLIISITGYFLIHDILFERRWKELNRLCTLGKSAQVMDDYKKLCDKWNGNSFFLYNYGAELNRLKRFEESNTILLTCEKYFNDYDVQMLLGDNYMNLAQWENAEKHFIKASYMCPVRFLPLSKLVTLYDNTNQPEKASELATHILNKTIKVPSYTINSIKAKMQERIEN